MKPLSPNERKARSILSGYGIKLSQLDDGNYQTIDGNPFGTRKPQSWPSWVAAVDHYVSITRDDELRELVSGLDQETRHWTALEKHGYDPTPFSPLSE